MSETQKWKWPTTDEIEAELAALRAMRDGLARLHVDAKRWLTESDDRPSLRAAENRIRLLLDPKAAP